MTVRTLPFAALLLTLAACSSEPGPAPTPAPPTPAAEAPPQAERTPAADPAEEEPTPPTPTAETEQDAEALTHATTLLDAMQAGDAQAALAQMAPELREQKRQDLTEGLGNPDLGFRWAELQHSHSEGAARYFQAAISWVEEGEEQQGVIELVVTSSEEGLGVTHLENR